MPGAISGLSIIDAAVNTHPFIFVAIIIWSFLWKGFVLWKSARLSHKYWFIAILVINTLGILEIIYFVFVARKYSVKVEES